MRRALLPFLLLAWAAVAVAAASFALAQPGRDAVLGAVSSIAAAGLALLAWRAWPSGPWASLPLWGLLALPLLDALWWRTPWPLLLALPPLALLALEPARRRPLLAGTRGQAVLVAVVAYLALAPPLDGMLTGPPAPARMDALAQGVVVGAREERRVAGGSGLLAETPAFSEGLPPVGLVALTLDPGADLEQALQSTYTPATESIWPFSLFFLATLALYVEDRASNHSRLSPEWERVGLETKSTFMFLVFPIPSEDGRRQVFLLRDLGPRAQLTLLPPFVVTWERYAGFRLHEAGDNSAALARLDGMVRADGVLLDAPPAAYEGLSVGPYSRTPDLGLGLAALGIAAAARLVRGRTQR